MTSYQDGRGADAGAVPERYWTLAANPVRFRVVDAVRDLEEGWWLTGRAGIRAGDRVAIWKYKGPMMPRHHRFRRGAHSPEMRDQAETMRYWSTLMASGFPGVRVRYVIKPSEPLWLELAPADSVVRQLPVSRAQGGTAHQVTSGQWAQLMTLVAAGPGRTETSTSGRAAWTVTEIRPAVTSYFTVLRASSRASHTSRPSSTARCKLPWAGRAALWSTSSRTSVLFSETSAFHTFRATSQTTTIRMSCVLRWSASSSATRRSRASSTRSPNLTCPQRRSSWRSIRRSWLRQAPAAAAGLVGVDYLNAKRATGTSASKVSAWLSSMNVRGSRHKAALTSPSG